MFKRLIALGLAMGAISTALPAHAEDCASREQVVSRLQMEYAEQLTGAGLNDVASGNTMIEVWSSSETGTFTVMSTDAQGISCILATGTDWFRARPVPQKAGLES